MKKLERVVLSLRDRGILRQLITGGAIPLEKIYRYEIIRMLDNNHSPFQISKSLGISRPTVYLWHKRFLSVGFNGLKEDAPRSGRPHTIDEEKRKMIIEDLIQKNKKKEPWTYRSLEKVYGISEATIRRFLKSERIESPAPIGKK